MTEEIWKAIEGYEGLYEVSDHGRVRGLTREVVQINRWDQIVSRTLQGQILKKNPNQKGYFAVHLAKDGKTATKRVSRLVAKAFLPNPNKHPQVNHMNGDKANDAVTNIEWITNKENQQHSWRELNRQQSGPEKRPVIAENKESIRYFTSLNEPTKYGIGASQVANTLAGRQKTCHGFYWRYATPEEIDFYERLAA